MIYHREISSLTLEKCDSCKCSKPWRELLLIEGYGEMLRTKYRYLFLSREEIFFLKGTTKMRNYSCEVNVG